jgi:hypothetical protein
MHVLFFDPEQGGTVLESRNTMTVTRVAGRLLRCSRGTSLQAGLVCALAWSAAPALADPPVYSVLEMQIPPGSPLDGSAIHGVTGSALNNQGDIAFTASTADFKKSRGFVWRYSDAHAFELGTLGGTSSKALGMNDCGDVVGVASLKGDATSHAALFRRGSVIDLAPQNKASGAAGINNQGVAVGFITVSGDSHPALFQGGTARDLTGQPGQALAISLSGQIAGFWPGNQANNFVSHGFVIKNGKLTDISNGPEDATSAVAINDFGDAALTVVPGATFSLTTRLFQDGHLFGVPAPPDLADIQAPTGINNSGDVVGAYDTSPVSFFATLIRGQKIYTLNQLVDSTDPLAPFVSLTQAFGINDSGWIASEGADSRDTKMHIYLLKTKTPGTRLERVTGGCPQD